MAESLLQQAELLYDQLWRLASSGLRFLQTELELPLAGEPVLCPSWVLLSAVLLLLLVVTVFWAAACGGAARKTQRTTARSAETTADHKDTAVGTENDKSPPVKSGKTEEPKKKNKKKATEKSDKTPRPQVSVTPTAKKEKEPQKTQPNGRAVPVPREETKVVQEIPKQAAPPQPQPVQPQPPPADKTKKNKKKPKLEPKQSPSISTLDGKEPDEGAWETKVSNREKRQQRRKEKGPGDDSGSPAGGDHGGQQAEQPVVTAPVSTKKNKESLNAKAEKRDSVITPVPSVSSVNSGGWVDMKMKLPPQGNASNTEKWSVGLKKSGPRNAEPMAWGQESEASWTSMDGRIKTELNTVNFTMHGLNAPAVDPVPQSAGDLGKWDGMTAVDNEWSGFNGAGDPGSDWNAPTEMWGNYEEPKAEASVVKEAPVSQPPRFQDSDDDKEKGDPSGSGKSKRKKKKKKKPEDENAAPQVNTGGLPAAAESSETKPRPHVPQEEPAKQNVLPASQKKTDQNWEPPKQVQKKKARRET